MEGESNGSKKHACTIKLPVCTCSRQSDAQDEDLDRSRPGGRGGAVTVAAAAAAAACAGLVGAVLFSDCSLVLLGTRRLGDRYSSDPWGGRLGAGVVCLWQRARSRAPSKHFLGTCLFFLRPRPTYPTNPPTLSQPNQISLVC